MTLHSTCWKSWPSGPPGAPLWDLAQVVAPGASRHLALPLRRPARRSACRTVLALSRADPWSLWFVKASRPQTAAVTDGAARASFYQWGVKRETEAASIWEQHSHFRPSPPPLGMYGSSCLCRCLNENQHFFRFALLYMCFITVIFLNHVLRLYALRCSVCLTKELHTFSS